MAVELLKFRTAVDPKSKSKSKPQNLSNMEPVFALLINVLSGYLVGDSRKNELYVGQHMDFFLNQISDSSVSFIMNIQDIFC